MSSVECLWSANVENECGWMEVKWNIGHFSGTFGHIYCRGPFETFMSWFNRLIHTLVSNIIWKQFLNLDL